jgi:hypothetical protein
MCHDKAEGKKKVMRKQRRNEVKVDDENEFFYTPLPAEF